MIPTFLKGRVVEIPLCLKSAFKSLSLAAWGTEPVFISQVHRHPPRSVRKSQLRPALQQLGQHLALLSESLEGFGHHFALPL